MLLAFGDSLYKCSNSNFNYVIDKDYIQKNGKAWCLENED